MAYNFADVTRSLVIGYPDGVTEGGKEKVKTFTVKGLSETATAEQVDACGRAIAQLMGVEPVYIRVKDTNEIFNV